MLRQPHKPTPNTASPALVGDKLYVAARQGNAPVEILVMEEGGGWDMDAAAILRGTKKPEAVRRLMDFAASRKANELYASFVSQVAMEGVAGVTAVTVAHPVGHLGDQPVCAGQFAAAQRPATEWIQHDFALRQAQLHQEVAGEGNAFDI